MTTSKKQSGGKRSRSSAAAEAHSSSRFLFEPLDKDSFTPMYFQIQTQLLNQIKSGHLRPGDALPGEEELTRIYGVSRMTSRQALQALTAQGLAYRQKGRGTFVLQPKVEKDIAHLLGFSAEMRTLGFKVSSRVLERVGTSAPPEIALRLRIEPEAAALHLRRLRLVDAEPVAIEDVWLSQSQFPGIEKIDFGRSSLYEALRERYGVRVGSADEVIEARLANKQEAELLAIAPKSSLLVISRTLLSMDGKPVEAGLSIYRGDRYRAVLRVPATAAE
ncbi:MAG TPA: GntR family transcriptional regulator [Edaphobacter sp.]|nr:GntR family transcriptional regulator [Edaphobacter sp.]